MGAIIGKARRRRWLLGAVASVVMLNSMALPALAEDGAGGIWAGRYRCAQGVTGLDLLVWSAGGADVRALFHFATAVHHNPVPEGCFTLRGRLDAASGEVLLLPEAWVLQPPLYLMVGMAGHISDDGAKFTGQITNAAGCTRFVLHRATTLPTLPPACAAAAPKLVSLG